MQRSILWSCIFYLHGVLLSTFRPIVVDFNEVSKQLGYVLELEVNNDNLEVYLALHTTR